jgi:hypothetical protein
MTSSNFHWSSLLLIAWILTTSSGATCARRQPIAEFQPPMLFETTPTIEQVAEVLSRSQRIEQLQSNAVSVRLPGLPGLSASMVWQRPRGFRLQGGLNRITGTDFDLGSNEEFFWMATRHGPSPTLLFARHDQFESLPSKPLLPVSPLWMVEALGIVSLDPNSLAAPMQQRADDALEVHTRVPMATGPGLRSLVIDPKYGYPKQIFLRDPTGRLIASATLSQHQLYESVQYSLPHRVELQLTPEGTEPLALQMEVGYYAINNIEGNDPQRWTMPDSRGYTAIDLARLPTQGPGAAVVPTAAPPSPTVPEVSYRGMENIFR